jgi:hypothetical protein
MPRFHYDVSPAALVALLQDPAFLEERARAAGDRGVSVTSEAEGPGRRVVVDREVKSEIPRFARRVFSDTNRVVDRSLWRREGRWVCTFEVEIHGAPIELTGRSTVMERDGGCTMEIATEIEVRVPLLGRKLERVIRDRTLAGLERDAAFTRSYLANA